MENLMTPTEESKAFAETGKCTFCLKEGPKGEPCSDHPEMVYTHMWANLNDAFDAGDLEVWYLKREASRTHGSFGKKPDPTNLEATHILVGKVAPETLDDLWIKLQGESWSPNGEANEFVRGLGVHTSMSVGDCFRLDGEVWRTESFGFEKV